MANAESEPLLAYKPAAQRNSMSYYKTCSDSIHLIETGGMASPADEELTASQGQSSYASFDEESLRKRAPSSSVGSQSGTDEFIKIEVREGEHPERKRRVVGGSGVARVGGGVTSSMSLVYMDTHVCIYIYLDTQYNTSSVCIRMCVYGRL